MNTRFTLAFSRTGQWSDASGPQGPSNPGTAGAVAADTQTAALTAWPGESDRSTITTHFSLAAPVRSPVLISSGVYPGTLQAASSCTSYVPIGEW